MSEPLSNPELEARILANPDDTSAWLVYGDWLSERDDPRGELVAVQVKLAAAPDDAALRAREQSLLATHKQTWLGDLADKGPKDLAVTWRHGFLSSVRFGPPLDDYETSEIDFAESIATFMALPGIAFVREIVAGSKYYDDYPTTWSDVVEALAEHGVPAGLTRLEFNRGGYWDISSTELGDLSPLYPHLKNLRELTIELGNMDLGDIDLPALRSLEIVTGGLKAANIASIVAARWPSLERLSLYIGESGNDYGCDVELDHLAPVLAGQNLARVRHLGLANASLADEIAAALPRSKILPQLKTLDLSRGTFSDDGARTLLANASAFKHLEQIDLTHSYVSDGVAAELSRLGPRVILDDQQEGDDDGDEVYRYVQIGE